MINRKRYSYWNQKVFQKTLIVPFVIFSLFCIFIFNIEESWYTSNLQTVNRWILDFDGNAQTWVNISVSFRDKMILVYFAFQIMFATTFVMLAYYAYGHRCFLSRLIILRAKSSNVDLVAETFATGVVLILAFGILFTRFGAGSATWMELGDLDNSSSIGLFTDRIRMNTAYGFIINKLAEVGTIWISIFFPTIYLATLFTRVFNIRKNHYDR